MKKFRFVSPTFYIYSDYPDFDTKFPVNSQESFEIAREIGIAEGIPRRKRKERKKSTRREESVFNYDHFIFISPDGERYKVESMKTFCQIHGLCRGSMYAVMRGLAKSTRGWTAEKIIANT